MSIRNAEYFKDLFDPICSCNTYPVTCVDLPVRFPAVVVESDFSTFDGPLCFGSRAEETGDV